MRRYLFMAGVFGLCVGAEGLCTEAEIAKSEEVASSTTLA
jgi:hypothetical protein